MICIAIALVPHEVLIGDSATGFDQSQNGGKRGAAATAAMPSFTALSLLLHRQLMDTNPRKARLARCPPGYRVCRKVVDGTGRVRATATCPGLTYLPRTPVRWLETGVFE
jgi:hypothetical protein